MSVEPSAYRLGFVVMCVAASLASCTLLSASGDEVQCESDADCADLGDGSSYCDTESQVCVVASPQGSSTSTSAATTTSATTTSSTSGTGGGGPGCVSNAQCIDDNGQLPYICRNDACVPLLNENCTELIGSIDDLRAESPLILGYIGRYTGPEEELLSSQLVRSGVRLAVEEIQSTAKGLPIGGGDRRPLLYLGCDEVEDHLASARHLIDDVGVPALIAPESDDKALEVAVEVAIPANVMTVFSFGKSVGLLSLDDNGLVWVANFGGRVAPEGAARLMANVEPGLRTRAGVAKGEPLRLAELVRNDAAGLGEADVFESTAEINGMSLGENLDAGTFERFAYAGDDDLSASAVAIIEYEPDVLVLFGESQDAELVRLVEEGWSAPVRPSWFLDESGYDYPLINLVDERTDVDPDMGDRFMGFRPFLPPDRSNYDAFRLRFRGRFDGTDPGTNSGPVGYDTTYMFAFAALGAGEVPVLDGRALATGMTKIVGPGAAINVGPTELNQAISSLSAGTNIDFNGVLGSYTFDLATGSSEPFASVWCTTAGSSPSFAIDPMQFDPLANELTAEALSVCDKFTVE